MTVVARTACATAALVVCVYAVLAAVEGGVERAVTRLTSSGDL